MMVNASCIMTRSRSSTRPSETIREGLVHGLDATHGNSIEADELPVILLYGENSICYATRFAWSFTLHVVESERPCKTGGVHE